MRLSPLLPVALSACSANGEPSGWLTLAVSLLAIAASTWAVISAQRSSRSHRQVKERSLSLESARERERRVSALQAALEVFIMADGSCSRLFIRNDGSGKAVGIACTIDGEPLKTSRLLAQGERPPTTLGANAEASVLLLTHESSPPMVSVSITWEDDSQITGRWDSDLTLLRH